LVWSRPAEPLSKARAWMFPAEFTGGAEPELVRVTRDLVLTELLRSPMIALVTAPEITRALQCGAVGSASSLREPEVSRKTRVWRGYPTFCA